MPTRTRAEITAPATEKKEAILAWDATRPIPWRRLTREVAIFLVLGAVAITLFVKPARALNYVGLLVGMMFYVAFAAVLAKFGYDRDTLRATRARTRAVASTPTAPTQTGRQRPAPTRRTSTGPSQRPNRSNKKRRR
jgi:Mn2+/Fe2+ NRAMP family transporter